MSFGTLVQSCLNIETVPGKPGRWGFLYEVLLSAFCACRSRSRWSCCCCFFCYFQGTYQCHSYFAIHVLTAFFTALTYIPVYCPTLLTNSMEHSPSGETNRLSACQEISHFYGTRRFITAFTNARHLSLS